MSRGRGFTVAEIDCLLEIIDDVLPIGPNDWDRVTERHCTFYPGLGRTRESLRRKFASLYNHKKPTGDPSCPVYVRNAKHIFERIKEAMDLSDGEGGGVGGGEDEGDDEEGEEDGDVAVPQLPPLVNLGVGGAIEEENGGAGGVSVEGGESSVRTGQSRASQSAATTPLVGSRIRTPRQNRNAGASGNSSTFSDMMQFILMRAEVDNQAEQRRRQEREELEERRRREREEAEDRRERRMERQLQSQSEMMKMFMVSMMDRRLKRKRDDSDVDSSDSGSNDDKGREDKKGEEGEKG